MCRFRFHRVGQGPQALDGNGDRQAGRQVAHAGGGARQDQVAGLEGHHRGDEDDQLGDGEDHIAGGSHLAQLFPEVAGDQGIGGVKLGVDPGTHRAKGIEALAARPGAVGALQVAGGDVIGDGVAEGMRQGVAGLDPAPALADHQGELGFMLHLARLGRQADWVAGTHQAGVRLEEDHRHRADLVVEFLGVGGVVAPNADDLPGLDGGQQPHRVDRDVGFQPAVGGEGVAVDLADAVLVEPAVAGAEGGGGEAQDFHVLVGSLSG